MKTTEATVIQIADQIPINGTFAMNGPDIVKQVKSLKWKQRRAFEKYIYHSIE